MSETPAAVQTISSAGSRPAPSGGFELYAWLFMRLSGLLLLFLALGHLVIMHLINNVGTINYDFVAQRFAKTFWRGYDLALLLLALFHGMNGLRTIIDDYLKGGKRKFVLGIVYVLWFAFTVIGTWAIVTFQPK